MTQQQTHTCPQILPLACLKAAIEAYLTVRAICLSLMEQGRQSGLQLKNLKRGCSVFSRALPLFLITNESWLSECHADLSICAQIALASYVLRKAF